MSGDVTKTKEEVLAYVAEQIANDTYNLFTNDDGYGEAIIRTDWYFWKSDGLYHEYTESDVP